MRAMWRRMTEPVKDYFYAVRSALDPPASRVLFTFNDPSDIDKFQVTTDQVLGGDSVCALELAPSEDFAVFHGVISPPDYEGRENRGGFASFRTKPFAKPYDLEVFEALKISVRTDGRPYLVNLKSSDYHPHLLFQGRILTPPGQWTTLALPFSKFVLTERGTVSLVQHAISTGSINGFGILLADGNEGPFEFHIAEVEAIRSIEADEHLALPAAAETGELPSAAAPSYPNAMANPVASAPPVEVAQAESTEEDWRLNLSLEDEEEEEDEDQDEGASGNLAEGDSTANDSEVGDDGDGLSAHERKKQKMKEYEAKRKAARV